jgi:putative proteasome-type protease
LPLDMQFYDVDSFALDTQPRVTADDPYFQAISTGWGDALRNALMLLPKYERK